jgi:hypothetical protein
MGRWPALDWPWLLDARYQRFPDPGWLYFSAVSKNERDVAAERIQDRNITTTALLHKDGRAPPQLACGLPLSHRDLATGYSEAMNRRCVEGRIE